MAKDSEYILEILTEYGMLTEDQVNEGWEKVAASEGKLDILGALKALKYLNENEMMSLLAQQYGLETLDLNEYQVPLEAVESLTSDLAKQYKVIPVMKHDNLLTIAMSDPTDVETLDALRYVLGCDVEAVVSPRDQIDKLISHHYGSV